MIAITNYFGRSEQDVLAALVREAKSDLVFVMNLSKEAENFRCTAAEIPTFMCRAMIHLLEHGAVVGWGDPDSPSWRMATEFVGPANQVAARILESWQRDPRAFDALAFANRDPAHAA